jgi:hypothetical protein
MSEAQYERTVFRSPPVSSSRGDNVSPGLKAGDPELAAFLENLYARNLPEMEEAENIRNFVRMRQRRDAA